MLDLLNPAPGAIEPIDESDIVKTVVSKVLRAAARNFEDTAELLDPVAIEQSAEAILNARRIEIYAVGILIGSIAHHAEGRLVRSAVIRATNEQPSPGAPPGIPW